MSNNNNSNAPKQDMSQERNKPADQKSTAPANASNDNRSHNVQQHGSAPAQTTNSEGGEQKKPEIDKQHESSTTG